LVGILQAPTVQDGSKSKLLRIVTIDVATGTTHEYGYELSTGSGVSEIVALNDHQFLVDERDGAGVGGDPGIGVKGFYVVDLDGATDITNLDATDALADVVPKTKLVDFAGLLTDAGIPVPSKIEGLAFGSDVMVDGKVEHTLYVTNDNDFVPDESGLNQFFVVGISDADLAAVGASYVPQQFTVREPAGLLLLGAPVAGLALVRRRRRGQSA
jgi:Esterase-like activity of phytase